MNFFSKKTIKIPPPIVTLLFCLIMWLLDSLLTLRFNFIFQDILIVILLVLACFLLLPAGYQFYTNKTTVNPLKPETATVLVVDGLYRFTRNPMYLGMAFVLLAWGLYLGNPLNLLIFVFYIVYMNYFQIMIEEAALEKCFGADFLDYKFNVRRWL